MFSEEGAETLSDTEPVKPLVGVRATVEVPLLPCTTVTFVAVSVKGPVNEETVIVRVPDEAELAAAFEGVKFAMMV